MNLKRQISLWVPFVITSLLTVFVYTTLWAIRQYWVLLSLFGFLSAIFAVRILVHTGLRPWPIVWVVLGLVIGQWWLIEFGAAMLFWSIGGFAP
jgi:uncharacterized membrane protein YqgA involved in biofilm formation